MSNRFAVPEVAIHQALDHYETPFYLYDATKIAENTNRLYGAMMSAGFGDFQNYFAVKATPNPHILKQLIELGHGLDCSSPAELVLAETLGVSGEEIIFTANNTTIEEFEHATRLGAIINFDDESHIDNYLANIGSLEFACCRYNPGNITIGNEDNLHIIGKPSEAKFGMDRSSIIRSYQKLKNAGVKRFGLHTMLLSNNLSWQEHSEIARVMFELAHDIAESVGIKFEFINLGGGIGVNYHPDELPFDYKKFAASLRSEYDDNQLSRHGEPRIVMENGRSIMATAGCLVTKVINRKQTHKTFIGLNASMTDFARPAMLSAYHQTSLLNDDETRDREIVDITGSLCISKDKFAVDRDMPRLDVGDYVIIHDTGAHGYAMGSNYNGRLRPKELLVDEDGVIRLIRRAETTEDLFATITPMEATA